jgi:hypothetical protein
MNYRILSCFIYNISQSETKMYLFILKLFPFNQTKDVFSLKEEIKVFWFIFVCSVYFKSLIVYITYINSIKIY